MPRSRLENRHPFLTHWLGPPSVPLTQTSRLSVEKLQESGPGGPWCGRILPTQSTRVGGIRERDWGLVPIARAQPPQLISTLGGLPRQLLEAQRARLQRGAHSLPHRSAGGTGAMTNAECLAQRLARSRHCPGAGDPIMTDRQPLMSPSVRPGVRGECDDSQVSQRMVSGLAKE